MKRYGSLRKGALLAMVVFLALAVLFFALGVAFFRSAGGVFFALWLFFFISFIGSLVRALPTDGKKRREKKKEEKKEDSIEDYILYDIADDDF